MSFDIEKKLVIAVSSSALFDMTEADAVFQQEGGEAYRAHQNKNLDVPFKKGIAYPFVKRLLNLNKLYAEELPVEVVVLSKTDADTGRRFFRSCQHYGLDICRGAFLAGQSPHPYIPSFNASLLLSANEDDVKSAIEKDLPAGLVLPGNPESEEDESTGLRIAFDFDGVLADDEAEIIYQSSGDLEEFHKAETKRNAIPHNPGPLWNLLNKISYFQKLERKKEDADPRYVSALKVAIITARSAPANERLITTLNSWQISVDQTFFMGGVEKKRVLEVLKPHIFFDDHMVHLKSASSAVPSVHIPFGVINKHKPKKVKP